MPSNPATLLGMAAAALACLFTVAVGRRAERTAAAAWGLSVLFSFAGQRITGVWDPVALLAAIDLVTLVCLLGVAWRDRSLWSCLLAALQAAALVLDVLHLAAPGLRAYTYLFALAALGYGEIAVIAYAGVASLRRRWRGGPRAQRPG